ncbi:MAG: guanylate kinase [Candidatus Hydrogenedentes bacterium]|nr:guanylate kinase [Candidatus Hydrogenedentota bacterium]
MTQPGLIVVISAPSGAGKLTLLTKVREACRDLSSTVSATTRPKRQGEVDGKHYHFLDRSEFERRVAVGEFAEWAEVHGNLYGTLRSELDRCLRSGHDVLLELDVQGMRNLRRLYPDAVTIFLMPPSLEELERRLRKRGTDGAAEIALRLRNAQEEMLARNEFDYIIVNEVVERAAGDMIAIMRAEHCRSHRVAPI